MTIYSLSFIVVTGNLRETWGLWTLLQIAVNLPDTKLFSLHKEVGNVLLWTCFDVVHIDTHSPGQVDDSQNRVNGNADGSKKAAVPSLYQQFMTSEDEAGSSSAHSSDEEEEEEVETNRTTVKSTSVSTASPSVKVEAPVSPAPVKESVKVRLMVKMFFFKKAINA